MSKNYSNILPKDEVLSTVERMCDVFKEKCRDRNVLKSDATKRMEDSTYQLWRSIRFHLNGRF